MTTRTIIVEDYTLPGGQDAAEVDVKFTLTDSSRQKIIGFREGDDTGIVGTKTITLDSTTASSSITLTPTDEIYPSGSYWAVDVEYDCRPVRRGLVQMTSGSSLSLPEFLALDTETGYWDVYENRLLPDPSGEVIGSMAAVSSAGGTTRWVVTEAPAGTGTVTSVAISGSDGIAVDSGSPITTNGTIALGITASALLDAINVEDGADVTDAPNVTSAGALMDSEVTSLSGVKSLTIPDSTTISAYGATLVAAAAGTAARSILDVDASGTDNSTNVSLAGSPEYITISGQVLTRNPIDLTSHVTGDLPASNLSDTAVTPGSYTNTDITVDQQGRITAASDGAGGGGLSSIVGDTTPQLGGQLDVNSYAIGDGTLELITFVEDVSAVNNVEIENEATGSGPIIRSTGDDTNVDLDVATKGSGSINLEANTAVTGNLSITGTVDGRDVATDGTKLDAIEASADVTDTTNVTSAGALMDSEVTSLSGIKSLTVPDSTTITSFGASIIDDANEAAFKATVNLEDTDINTLINARIAAMQASGDLPPDPSTLAEGDMLTVSATGKYVKVG